MDNLQSMTYQTFEQDPVKYRNYEEVKKGLIIPSFTAVSKWLFLNMRYLCLFLGRISCIDGMDKT